MQRVLAQMALPLVLVAGLSAAPATSNTKPRPAPHNEQPKPYQVGRASWYGKQFHGRTTASGEAYDMFQFTAAHRQLPLGTWVRVTNLRNGQWVVVRINDRGPVPQDRIIDLSYGAAQMIGLRARGTEKVRLDIMSAPVMARAQDLAGQE